MLIIRARSLCSDSSKEGVIWLIEFEMCSVCGLIGHPTGSIFFYVYHLTGAHKDTDGVFVSRESYANSV